MLKDNGGIPARGNQKRLWDAGCRFDFANPDYRWARLPFQRNAVAGPNYARSAGSWRGVDWQPDDDDLVAPCWIVLVDGVRNARHDTPLLREFVGDLRNSAPDTLVRVGMLKKDVRFSPTIRHVGKIPHPFRWPSGQQTPRRVELVRRRDQLDVTERSQEVAQLLIVGSVDSSASSRGSFA
jgi:hypothetical protein